jgi:hypothetical protein
MTWFLNGINNKSMQELIAAGKVATATGIAMLATIKGSVNVEDGRVSVAVAISCTVFICGIVWWLSSRFQKIADQAELTNKRLDAIESRIANTEFRQQTRDNNDDKRSVLR